jgi:uncharacterized protein with von Willebrand factor type A (vWA) domain
MFQDFFYRLKAKNIPVSTTELIDLIKITAHYSSNQGHMSLKEFYTIARSCLIKDIKYFDDYDLVFASTFANANISDEKFKELLSEWLRIAEENELSEDRKSKAMKLSPDEVFEEFKKRLEEQKERHDKGNYWVGTGGTSAFGNKGYNQNGIRVGGDGGEGIALQIIGDRNYKEYRTDESLNVRQLKVALKKLRDLRKDGRKEFQLEPSIKKTCENAGDLELIFQSSRKNRLKLMLLMDVGGSMTPHSNSVSRLFSAAHQINHFKEFHYFYFHNIIYDRVFLDSNFDESITVDRLMKKISSDTKVIFVGDGAMNPYELYGTYGSIYSFSNLDDNPKKKVTGMNTLTGLTKNYKNSIWLNPDSPKYWNSTTCEAIWDIIPMYYLSIDGLDKAILRLKNV